MELPKVSLPDMGSTMVILEETEVMRLGPDSSKDEQTVVPPPDEGHQLQEDTDVSLSLLNTPGKYSFQFQ
jgi:hypothetical protein